MPEFVLNRNYVLVGKGHRIGFKTGQPTFVVPSMVREAAAIGAVPVDGSSVELLDPEVVPVEVMTGLDREAAIFKAFDTLIARNERDAFGGDGKPTISALRAQVGFSVDRKERDAMYQKYRELKADAE